MIYGPTQGAVQALSLKPHQRDLWLLKLFAVYFTLNHIAPIDCLYFLIDLTT